MVGTEAQQGQEEVLGTLLGLLEESVVAFDDLGTVVMTNDAVCELLGTPADQLVGMDVKDFFYTVDLVRPQVGELPFPTDGSSVRAMAKARDGSFVPVRACCRAIASQGVCLLVASVDTQYEADREHARLLDELHRANARLHGALSIVAFSTLGDGAFSDTARNFANELQSVLAADAAVLCLTDDYGFVPYGVSDGFDALRVEKACLPMDEGVFTLVARNRRTTCLQLVSLPSFPDTGAVMLDLDSDMRFRVRSALAEHCSTVVGTPVFSNGRVVAVAVAGWSSPHRVDADEVELLDTVAESLSVKFAAAVSRMEQERTAGFAAATNEVRDLVREEGEMTTRLAARIAGAVGKVVPSRIMVMESGPYSQTTIVRLYDECGDGELDALEYPHGMSEVFADGTQFVVVAPDSPCGMWIGRHTDLSGGFGILLTGGELSGEPLQEALLVLRGPRDHPFAPSERAFLRNLAKEVGNTLHAEQERAHDAEISRALQVGLRNELPPAEGLTTASLYISATESAVVGGDFFDLYDLSQGHAILVMGDVSGKGVEAAAMASLVKTALAAYAWNYLDPASMVSSLNNLFLNFSRLETFASLVVVSVDFSSNQATYCSAGHPPAMLVHHPGTPTADLELLTVQSPIVGAFEGFEYVNGAFEFGLGDILYLYTDGTTEARSSAGDFFGEDALRDTLLHACRRGVEHVPEEVLAEVEEFAGGDLHDDIAMVAVRFDGISRADGTDGPAA